MEIKKLDAEHYDEIIGILNEVFTEQNGRIMDFEKEIPKMCIRDDEHMSRHIGIFDEGKLVACMGVYPFEAIVAGKKLKLATVGNVVTRKSHEGRGYMSAMFDVAMNEVERLDIDAARLSGLRSRYNRYGFEACGQNYNFTFTAKNRQNKCPEYKGGIRFEEITAESKAALAFAAELYNKNKICVPRTADNAMLSLTMWKNTPYIALKGNESIGYLSANDSGKNLAEQFAVDTEALSDMLCAWQERVDTDISFSLQAHQVDAVRLFSAICEYSRIQSPSHFFIRNFARFTDAFMKLKASVGNMMVGELYLEIMGYGTVRMYADGNTAGCELCDHKPDITLDRLAASRYVFGPYPPIITAEAPVLAQAWFPLPLSWNGQDRV